MYNQLRAVVEVLNRVLPDQGVVVPFVLDDTDQALLPDLLRHQALLHIVHMVTDRASIGFRRLVHTKVYPALLASKLLQFALLGKRVDRLTADRTFCIRPLGLIKDDHVAAVRALASGQLVRADIDRVSAGAVDLFLCEESRLRLRVFPAVRAFDNEFRHGSFPSAA